MIKIHISKILVLSGKIDLISFLEYPLRVVLYDSEVTGLSRETGLLAKIYNMVKSIRVRINIVVRSNQFSPNHILFLRSRPYQVGFPLDILCSAEETSSETEIIDRIILKL